MSTEFTEYNGTDNEFVNFSIAFNKCSNIPSVFKLN